MERISFLNVACFKWGTLYSSEDVNKIRAMVARNLKIPHVVHCVTDDPRGLHPAIKSHPLLQHPNVHHDIGNARKTRIFESDFLGLEGQFVVAIDIDMVIIDDLTFLTEAPQHDFMITRGFGQYANTRGHAALYRLKVGSHAYVWDRLVADPAAAVEACQHHRGLPGHISDQRWLDRQIETMPFFPDGKVVYFRHHCGARGEPFGGRVGARLGLNTAMFGVAKAPPGTAVVSFAGQPKPADVARRRHGMFRRAPFVERHWRA